MLVPELGQLLRRPCATQDRPEDGPPGDAGDVAEDFGQLQVHLLQGLLQVLHVPAGLAVQVGPLPQVGPQPAGLLVGPEGRRQQADAVQPVDPLAVAAVRLGTPPQLVAVAGVDQEDLEPLGLEQLVQGDPVDAGRFQGDRGDLMLPQECGNGFQASRMSRAGNSRIKQEAASVVKPTQTQWERLPMSMPAACGCCTGSASTWAASRCRRASLLTLARVLRRRWAWA